MTHTPGPWVAGHGRLVRVIAKGTGECICGVHRLGKNVGEDRYAEIISNARLIAAAPQMLEALEFYKNGNADSGLAARAAIAIAKGES
jgi:hypothetical protein